MSNIFEASAAEFERVFGCETEINYCADWIEVLAPGWPEAVRYDAAEAFEVLVDFDDEYGTDEIGDEEVCRALKQAGAVI